MIKGTAADIIVSIYILATLYLRFSVEESLESHPLLSLSLGFVMLIVLWAVIKIKWLQPNYFGLLDSKSSKKNLNDSSEGDDHIMFV